MLERIKNEVPDKSGCYIYKDKNGLIIYIGKAKKLKRRMSSYFNRVNNVKTTKLVSEITDFQYIVTNNEKESLILENRLIKDHQPKYNIMLKDDKNYPYILITAEEHPRILKVRDRKHRGDYFGPYPSNHFVNEIVTYLNRVTDLRKCHSTQKGGCIYYYLGQCYGPCVKEVSPEVVEHKVNQVKQLLKNDMSKLKTSLKQKMQNSVELLEFEQATKYRDLINLIDSHKENQAIEVKSKRDFDVVGFYYDKSTISIAILNIRKGRVNNIKLLLNSYYGEPNEAIISALFDYYQENEVSGIICSDENIASVVCNLTLMEHYSNHLKDYKALENMARDNAREYFKNNVEKLTKITFSKKNAGFEALQKLADDKLEIIEMFDISHLGGGAQVAGKIVYQNGKKNPKLYRKYKIKTAKANDEYGSMEEVLDRRIKRIANNEEKSPNLIILDGGKGQIGVALKILNKYKLESIKMIGLVKDDKHRTNAIINKNFQQIKIKNQKELYKFLYEMQEEVHRYAIDFHRKSKSNQMFISELEKIPGLGPKRKKLLFNEFKTIENIKSKTIEEFIEIGIPKNIAINIVKFYKKD